MKNKTRLLLLLGLILVTLFVNSCKKLDQGTIDKLLTSSSWQLASVTQTTYLGESTLLTETLNTTCGLNQIFVFKTDNTCTYTNFECLPKNAAGKWSFSDDKLTLYSDMICQDTTTVGSSKPFDTTRIVNLGQYSMVLETGPLNNNSTTIPRMIRRYGFVRQKTTN